MDNAQNEKLLAILKAKEERATVQLELIKKYNTPLVSFTLNIPGPNKNSNKFDLVHNIGSNLLEEELRKSGHYINYITYKEASAGREGFFSVTGDPSIIKNITINIEQTHTLGRLFDFDVFDEYGNQISRKNFNLKERSCLLCSENAAICRRNRSHTLEEVLQGIDKIISNYV